MHLVIFFLPEHLGHALLVSSVLSLLLFYLFIYFYTKAEVCSLGSSDSGIWSFKEKEPQALPDSQ